MNNQIPSLTPLRGMAAILVVLYHFQLIGRASLFPAQFDVQVIDKLYLMVDLFFVLSGFIILHVYGKSFENRLDGRAFRAFLSARFARIYPIHLLTLGWMLFLYFLIDSRGIQLNPIMYQQMDPGAISTSVLLIHALGMHWEAVWNTPSWSISTEWWAYMAFPLLAWSLYGAKAWQRWALVLAIIGAYLLIVYYFYPLTISVRRAWIPFPAGAENLHSINVITGPAMLRCLCGFMLGMLTYYLYAKKWAYRFLNHSGLLGGTWIALIGLLYMGWMSDILVCFIFAAIILMTAYNTGMGKQILDNRVMRYLGDISYSVYMVHMPLLFTQRVVAMLARPVASDTVGPPPSPGWLEFGLFLGITIVLATLSYYGIEKPMRSLLKGVLNVRRVKLSVT